MLYELKNKNDFNIYSVYDKEFKEYGRVLEGYDFSEVIRYMDEKTSVPSEGNIYVASCEEMEVLNIKDKIQEGVYGFMDIQIGYCNGNNSRLNALEYHKGSEVNVAVTDLVLFLSRVFDMDGLNLDTRNVKAFYLPKGTAVEIYSTTMHFAPCRVSDDGFKCVVILPKGTNTPITKFGEGVGEERLLFMKNKWIIAHGDRQDLINRGAHRGLVGMNYELKI
ncbi:DUF4867 family protein [Caloramator sp. ALD01]|uniref:DUF4867 family protein n=1 Tax=Caloramator sp. ALD01 TaxID=1031288 RepID=UPI0003FB5FD0|nr:DUF4867 family protein [Caloramator sp. ALD01]